MVNEEVGNLVIELYTSIEEFIKKYDPERKFRFSSDLKAKFNELLSRFKEVFIDYVLTPEQLSEAYEWVEVLQASVSNCIKYLGIKGVTFSKELRSFIEDPRAHLRKKIFIYTHDLVRGKLGLADYMRTASAAIRTSYRTNLRSAYQSWVLLEVLSALGKLGGRLVYPEHRYLPLDRSGKQRTGTIPPNAVVEVKGRGCLSFFVEAPRPIGWEDTSDLSRAWRLYTALRPDFMVYGGMVLNILEPESEPPVLRPNVIIECKELEDWYLRSRDIRGPLAKPLTAEEWRAKWIEGLWVGLADALGVKKAEVTEVISEKKGLRLKEYQLVTLYKNFYKPDRMYLVSRAKVPEDVRKHLEGEGIYVVDGVGFNSSELERLAEELLKYAKQPERTVIELSRETAELLNEVLELAGSARVVDEVIRDALKLLLNRLRSRQKRRMS